MELLIKKPELKELAELILHGLATDEDFQKAKIEDVRAIKSDNGVKHYRSMAAPLAKAAKDAPRTKRYIASDETVDRMGDIIRVKGWQFDEFAKNPTALYGHNSREFPIGTVSDWQKTRREGRPVLLETINYLAEGTTPQADIAWKLVDQGVLRAVSVGFLPIKSVWIDDPDERKTLGLGPWGIVYEEQAQLELSNCAIGANPNALPEKSIEDAVIAMVKAGQISESDARSVIELGEKKTVVTVPELPEPAKKEEQAAPPVEDDWYFKLDSEGRLCRVRVVNEDVPATSEEKAEVSSETETLPDADEALIPLEERMAQLEVAIEALSKQIEELPEKVADYVGRSFAERRRLVRTTFEAAINEVGKRISQENIR